MNQYFNLKRNLIFNNLTGTIPSSFEKLTELKYL